MDEEIEAPEEALEAMVDDGDDDLGDALTQKCPRGGGDSGGTIIVAS